MVSSPKKGHFSKSSLQPYPKIKFKLNTEYLIQIFLGCNNTLWFKMLLHMKKESTISKSGTVHFDL